ncbi:MAG: translation initiation factor IF-2 [Oscillospiraceae bacterium]|nr:translation initiation factor IF-2 [Oscillospiraceae bacterium]
MSLIKIRVKEVAADFGMEPKAIIEAIGKYGDKPRSNTQVLSDEQLNVLFDYLTQTHQVESIQEALNNTATQQQEEKPAEKAAEKSGEKAREKSGDKTAPKGDKAPRDGKNQRENKPTEGRPAKEHKAPEAPAKEAKAPEAPAKPKEEQRKRERRVVDTKAVTVNADRFDDRVDDMVSDRMQNYAGGKQKIGNKNKKKQDKKAGPGNKRRNEEQEKLRRLQLEIIKKTPLTVKIPDEITVGELASRMKKTAAELIKVLIKNGVMASVNQNIDFDTAEFVATELGCKVEREIVVTIEERLIDDHVDTEDELVTRSPVVVVMGHVDHGKTSLLDAVRKTNVASGEAGGITQHIGAYTVQINGNPITFLDTPGHAAFTSMRARGAMCTDVAILVVAADDGIMPQTVEAINHAKAANIPIIVAVNKMDKHGASPDRIMQQLTEYELVAEEWGGDTIICPISAKTGMGIDNLLEMVILTAEMQELKANPNRAAKGIVIESRLDKTRGPIATLLVQNGTLRKSDLIIAGTAVGHVRVMTDDKGRAITEAGPSVPVEITGLAETPAPGDEFNAVADERMARQLVEQRKQAEKDAAAKLQSKVTLDNLFAKMQEGEMKELNLIVKADVQGSAEAVKASLEKLANEEVRVRVIHAAVGAINESDILLASTSNAIIIGFNVRPDPAAAASAQRAGVDMRMYRVIYDAIEEIEAAMKGMLAPKFREAVIGHAEVRQTYKVSAIGTIAGCYVKDGKITRDAQVRVLRDNIVIYEGKLGSLQRFKDSVKEVASNYECGMSIEKFNDIKEGDIFECFIMEEIPR